MMPWVRAVMREVLGLFIDDGSYAAAIVVWLAIVWFVLPRLAIPESWQGPVLFAGLALILLDSVARRARR